MTSIGGVIHEMGVVEVRRRFEIRDSARSLFQHGIQIGSFFQTPIRDSRFKIQNSKLEL